MLLAAKRRRNRKRVRKTEKRNSRKKAQDRVMCNGGRWHFVTLSDRIDRMFGVREWGT